MERGSEAPETATTATTEAAATAAIGPVGLGLLALQAADDPAARDREAERRTESILQELRELQLGLLNGDAGDQRLERLAALEVGEAGADPRLREVVRAVVLRARVELARRGRTGIVSNA
ncbi:flagellar assembly protein FliX [Roseicella aquatilis]|uniref:Flagellar assembly protein FliX n=1 Tax=Roseicella aquatilis TaxID=2527868 RepID=A0A4R4DJ28_9PROT|nr:flagellar assembly protein FliX [Roseicella aquatilis]